jgi:hypothetical protein
VVGVGADLELSVHEAEDVTGEVHSLRMRQIGAAAAAA